METATKPGTEVRRLTLDVIKYVEDRQRPRENFGEAARRLFLDERERREKASAESGQAS
jgi:hypothetical protein